MCSEYLSDSQYLLNIALRGETRPQQSQRVVSGLQEEQHEHGREKREPKISQQQSIHPEGPLVRIID
jgi:hypothetical protein